MAKGFVVGFLWGGIVAVVLGLGLALWSSGRPEPLDMTATTPRLPAPTTTADPVAPSTDRTGPEVVSEAVPDAQVPAEPATSDAERAEAPAAAGAGAALAPGPDQEETVAVLPVPDDVPVLPDPNAIASPTPPVLPDPTIADPTIAAEPGLQAPPPAGPDLAAIPPATSAPGLPAGTDDGTSASPESAPAAEAPGAAPGTGEEPGGPAAAPAVDTAIAALPPESAAPAAPAEPPDRAAQPTRAPLPQISAPTGGADPADPPTAVPAPEIASGTARLPQISPPAADVPAPAAEAGEPGPVASAQLPQIVVADETPVEASPGPTDTPAPEVQVGAPGLRPAIAAGPPQAPVAVSPAQVTAAAPPPATPMPATRPDEGDAAPLTSAFAALAPAPFAPPPSSGGPVAPDPGVAIARDDAAPDVPGQPEESQPAPAVASAAAVPARGDVPRGPGPAGLSPSDTPAVALPGAASAPATAVVAAAPAPAALPDSTALQRSPGAAPIRAPVEALTGLTIPDVSDPPTAPNVPARSASQSPQAAAILPALQAGTRFPAPAGPVPVTSVAVSMDPGLLVPVPSAAPATALAVIRTVALPDLPGAPMPGALDAEAVQIDRTIPVLPASEAELQPDADDVAVARPGTEPEDAGSDGEPTAEAADQAPPAAAPEAGTADAPVAAAAAPPTAETTPDAGGSDVASASTTAGEAPPDAALEAATADAPAVAAPAGETTAGVGGADIASLPRPDERRADGGDGPAPGFALPTVGSVADGSRLPTVGARPGAGLPTVSGGGLGLPGAARDVPESATEDPAAGADLPALRAHAVPFDGADPRPRLAIVLMHQPGAPLPPEVLADLAVPVAFAIDPSEAGATDAAAAYRAAGFEVVIATGSLPVADYGATLAEALSSVPEAVALIGGPDGRIHLDRAVLSATLEVMAARGHGLVAYPRGLNTAIRTAERDGLDAASLFREIDTDAPGAAARILDRAAFTAGQQGRVIVAGPADSATIAAIVAWALGERSESVALAPLSATLLTPAR